jgi:phage antirepressor YoqD-like protein
LYMFSQQNNVEMGIYVSKKDDEKLYNQIAKEVDRIKRGSEHRTISVKKVEKIIPEPKIEKETPKTEAKKDYSKSKLLTTKEISQATGLSSRKVNAWLTDNKLMYKKDDDWFATKKGNEVGATQKSGSYGKFIVWPEEITVEVKE